MVLHDISVMSTYHWQKMEGARPMSQDHVLASTLYNDYSPQ